MPLPNDIELHFVDSISVAKDMLDWVMDEDHECIAFDLETTGLSVYDDASGIRLAQLGSYTTGWAVPWERWGGAFMEVLNRWQGPLIGHNTSFDNRWLQHFDGWKPPFERLHDTMIMAQIEESYLPAGLKDLGDRHIDRRASVGQKLLKNAMKAQGWGWDTVPVDFDIYWQYGCIDTILTAYLWQHYRTDLKFPEAYELEMSARRVLSAMEDNGIKVDLEYCQENIVRLENRVKESKQWAQDNWNINISSGPQVAKFFQESLGQEFTIFTAGGAPSTAKEQMEIFMNSDNEAVAKSALFIDQIKKDTKTANTYFKNFIDMATDDAVLHPSVRSMGARTGRQSVVNPALQTVTKGDPLLRNAFIPHEGQVLLSCDYSQVELRLMSHFSGDPGLIDAFHKADNEGSDFFTELGKGIFGDPNFSKKDDRRNIIKTFMYAFLYGAGHGKMAKTLKKSEAEIKEFVNMLDKAYPGIMEFQNKVIKQGEQRQRSEGMGYVITPSGRKLYADVGNERTLVNYLLQGTAAELMKESLIKLDAAGLTPYLLLCIHDEVVASVPEDNYDYYAKEIGEIMTIRDRFAVDLIADAEGPFQRWGQKYE